MGYTSGVVDNVFFVRWQDSVEVPDCQAINDEVAAAYEQAGKSLTYVGIVPVDLPPPGGEARAALKAGTEQVLRYCASVFVVIEGEGMRRALMRSVSAGLLLAMGMRGKGFQISESVEAALSKDGRDADDVQRVLARAGAEGLLAPPTQPQAAAT